MPRYCITLEYDGSGFAGWQRQENGASVQAAVEEAASAITGGRMAITVQGAGRTDAGVHATGQVAHFDLPENFPAHRLPAALNAHLPDSVRVLAARKTHDDFNARFDALRKTYRYRIVMRRAAPALARGFVWHIPQRLDLDAMRRAAKHLTGKHDFTSFRALRCQARSPIRTLDVLRLESAPCGDGDGNGICLALMAEARSFLHHQIRNITGTLVEAGRGKIAPDDMPNILAARDRKAAGPTAPAHGLTLLRVDYENLPPPAAKNPR